MKKIGIWNICLFTVEMEIAVGTEGQTAVLGILKSFNHRVQMPFIASVFDHVVETRCIVSLPKKHYAKKPSPRCLTQFQKR